MTYQLRSAPTLVALILCASCGRTTLLDGRHADSDAGAAADVGEPAADASIPVYTLDEFDVDCATANGAAVDAKMACFNAPGSARVVARARNPYCDIFHASIVARIAIDASHWDDCLKAIRQQPCDWHSDWSQFPERAPIFARLTRSGRDLQH